MEDISIHTPIKGVTALGYTDADKLEISIHTPIKGVTEILESRADFFKFQSTHP